MKRELLIGLAGCGTVGGGVWTNLKQNVALLTRRTGTEIVIARVATREPERARQIGVPDSCIDKDWRVLVEDPRLHVIVELMGGTTHARELVVAALKAGKHVVTANKALLAAHGKELFELAAAQKRELLFEASVAGGIPIIKSLREGLIANRILSLHGIVNGTCNYILTQMRDQGREYADVLADAKRLGYAEADESLDVDGHDTAHKACVLAALAYGVWIPQEKFPVEGIRSIDRQDIAYARDLGYELKLLAILKARENNSIEARVHPTLVPRQHVLASVNGVFNAISVRGDVVGDTLFYGRGAGANATASAVLSDIAEIARDFPEGRPIRATLDAAESRLLPMDEIRSRYYLRLQVEDRPGVLAQVATALGKRGIGISSVIQPENKSGETVPLIILLHESREADFKAARQEIEQLPAIKAAAIWLRVEDFAS